MISYIFSYFYSSIFLITIFAPTRLIRFTIHHKLFAAINTDQDLELYGLITSAGRAVFFVEVFGRYSYHKLTILWNTLSAYAIIARFFVQLYFVTLSVSGIACLVTDSCKTVCKPQPIA